VLPADRALQEMAGKLRDAQRRIERLETLEAAGVTAGAVCLGTEVIAGGAEEVTFSSISQDFIHLWLLIHAGQIPTANGAAMLLTFNGDSGSNYRSYNKSHVRFNDDTDQDPVVGGTGTASAIRLGHTAGNTIDNDNFCACEALILNYTLFPGQATVTKRSVVWKGWDYSPILGEEANLGFVGLRHGGGQWINTVDPITSLTVSAGGGFAEFTDDSIFTLIGLCAA